MIHFRFALIAAAAVALAACADNSPVADEAGQNDPAPAAAPANHSPAAEIGNEAASSSGEASVAIPEALHGRWGLTPADCEPQTARATGLLVVSEDQLRFYESVAEPVSSIEADTDSISGDWTFQGEGMTERRFQTLQIEDGKLVRSENGPSGSFTYVRCGGD